MITIDNESIKSLSKEMLVEFACRCSESILHIHEKQYKNNVSYCIDATRKFMRGDISAGKLIKIRRDACGADATAAASVALFTSNHAYITHADRCAHATDNVDAEREKQLGMLKELLR